MGSNYFNQASNSKHEKSASLSKKFREEGNIIFKRNIHNYDDHMNILSLYTKSIAFAAENSEELALGLGNRSALLFDIQKYEECIIDIDRALSITKSDNLKAKLSSRKIKCLEFFDKTRTNLKQTKVKGSIKLSPKMTPSKKVPCVAESVSLKYNEKFGKHMVANRDIKTGEIIAVEEAYITLPSKSKLYLVCSHCLNRTWNGVPCNFCTKAVYCSDNCKNQAWLEYHDAECSIISMNLYLKSGLSFSESHYKLGARLFIKVIKSHGIEKIIHEMINSDPKMVDGKFSCSHFNSCYHLAMSSFTTVLISHNAVSKIINALYDSQRIFTDEFKSFFESKDEMLTFSEEMLTKFISISNINTFTFTGRPDFESPNFECIDQPINKFKRGTIFVPCSSLFNHSCVPNLELVGAEKKTMFIYSNRYIRKGEQLFINYHMDLMCQPKTERQSFLRNKYNFLCACLACSEDWYIPLTDTCKDMDQTMLEIIKKNKEYCKKNSTRSILLTDPRTWDYSFKTFFQTINIIELIHEKRSDYEATTDSLPFKKHLSRYYWKYYGIVESEEMIKCVKTV